MKITGKMAIASMLGLFQSLAQAPITSKKEGEEGEREVSGKRKFLEDYIDFGLRRLQRQMARRQNSHFRGAKNERENARRRRQIEKGMLTPIFREHPTPFGDTPEFKEAA